MAAHSSQRSSGTAAIAAILLIGLGLAVAWWAIAPSVLGTAQAAPIQGQMAEVVAATPDAAALAEGVRISNVIQVTQSRDPFEPLVSDQTTSSGTSTGSTGGTSGGTTATRTSFTLDKVTDNTGVLTAEVTVQGVSYEVKVGDDFAGSFQVVSLTAAETDSGGSVTKEALGVFKYGDNTFTANAGQAILK